MLVKTHKENYRQIFRFSQGDQAREKEIVKISSLHVNEERRVYLNTIVNQINY